MEGEIKDSKTLEALSKASVQIRFVDQAQSLMINADSLGKVQIQRSSSISHIEVNYIGYRTLSVDLKGKKGLL
ncbi:hypothetical protein FOA19_12690 [Rufibacter hautae]|uniref:Uncharacterized protein n=2 Tax=Rufibacter hautae TaxID=2595005 RepID=A0A5B6TFR8_9BACT|nr:hypothetical protein FOA19_12690 [Rufibacter hautae]